MRIDIVLIVWKYWFPTFVAGTQAFWAKQNNSLCNKLILGIIYLISVLDYRQNHLFDVFKGRFYREWKTNVICWKILLSFSEIGDILITEQEEKQMNDDRYKGFRNPVLSVTGLIVSCFMIFACIESISEGDIRNALPIMSVTCFIMIPSLVCFIRTLLSHGNRHYK